MKLPMLGGFILCGAAKPKDWVDFVKPVLRQHNIYRCMHDLPLVHWSDALGDEAYEWADSIYPYTQTESVEALNAKMAHVFKDWAPVDQHSVLFQTAEEPLDPAGAWVQQIKKWYDAKGTARSSMLRPSTTYIGCGARFELPATTTGTTTTRPQPKKVHEGIEGNAENQWIVTFFCDYAGPNDRVVTEEVSTAEAVKKPEDCAKAVDAMFPPPDLKPKKVLITYDYKRSEGLRAGSQTDPCVAKYRLVINGANELRLIAVDENGNPCAKAYDYMGPDLQWWESSEGGMWSSDTDQHGEKVCLQADSSFGLITNPLSSRDKGCTIVNEQFPDGLWHFKQEFQADTPFAEKLCMQDVPEADGNQLEIQHTMLAATGTCSTRWVMEDFSHPGPPPPQALQTNLLVTGKKKTCKECLSDIGSFSCAKGKQCMLAPTEVACTSQGGEWCAAPPLKFPVCAAGHDDWRATKTKRRECKGGCSYDVCQKKIDSNTNPKLAVNHCYTLAEIANDGSLLDPSNDHPRGCNYGPRDTDNTCAVDDQGDCVYADLGSDDLMVIV